HQDVRADRVVAAVAAGQGGAQADGQRCQDGSAHGSLRFYCCERSPSCEGVAGSAIGPSYTCLGGGCRLNPCPALLPLCSLCRPCSRVCVVRSGDGSWWA